MLYLSYCGMTETLTQNSCTNAQVIASFMIAFIPLKWRSKVQNEPGNNSRAKQRRRESGPARLQSYVPAHQHTLVRATTLLRQLIYI
jgi:hypothetical protein